MGRAGRCHRLELCWRRWQVNEEYLKECITNLGCAVVLMLTMGALLVLGEFICYGKVNW